MTKPFYIEWNAKDALDGMNQLTPMEELAYRRIIDMIYASDNNLANDDKMLAWSTKTGRQWKEIKKRLLDLGKIEVVGNLLTNRKCVAKLEVSKQRIENQSLKGKISAEKRKALKNDDSASTVVSTAVTTAVDTVVSTAAPTKHQTPTKKVITQTPNTLPSSRAEEGVGVLKNVEEGKKYPFDISHHLTDSGREEARKAAPGWDLYNLARIYNEGVNSGKRERPNLPDKAFPAWCGKYTKGKPP